MKLLQPEVDITPGRPGTKQAMSPVQEGTPVPGSAVVHITNTTTQNNAYSIQLRCDDNAFWQQAWYRLIPLPPAPGDALATPAGKKDEIGPQGASVKIAILSGGTRDILIQFNVPKSPEARAGRYAYQVEIETQILSAQTDGARRENRMTRLPGIALVRPFYNWTFDLKKSVSDPRPEVPQNVGRRRATAVLELAVTNESNDWLCCDVLLPQPPDMDLACFTRRIAIRPPELGELLPASAAGGDSRLGIQRSVPVEAHTRLKTFRGAPVTQPIAISLQRVDAPTVPPTADDEFFVGTGKVLCRPTSEKQSLPGERAIVYCPPIPATLTDFFRGLITQGRTLVFAAIGLILVAHIFLLMWQQFADREMKIAVEGESFPMKATNVKVTGKLLKDAVFSIENKEDYVEIDEHDAKVNPKNHDEYFLTLPDAPKLNNKNVYIKAQRVYEWLPYLTKLLPSKKTSDFFYGTKPLTPEPVVEDRPIGPRDRTFTITGKSLGKGGTVFVNGSLSVKHSSWANTEIVASVPLGMKPGDQFPVGIQPTGAGDKVFPAGSIVYTQGGSNGGNNGGGNNGGGNNGGGNNGGGNNGGGNNGGGNNGGGNNGGGNGGPPPPPAPTTALEALNLGMNPEAEKLAKEELTKLEAVPDGPTKDYFEIEVVTAVRGFARLKNGDFFLGNVDISASKSSTTKVQGVVPKNEKIKALTSAAEAFDHHAKDPTDARALGEAKEAYKYDKSVLVVATTLAQIYNAHGHKKEGIQVLKGFQQAHSDEANNSPLFKSVAKQLGMP